MGLAMIMFDNANNYQQNASCFRYPDGFLFQNEIMLMSLRGFCVFMSLLLLGFEVFIFLAFQNGTILIFLVGDFYVEGIIS